MFSVLFVARGVALPSSPTEQADFLAGLPLPGSSVLAPLQKTQEYREHQKELQEQWAFCRRLRYDLMEQWGHDHLSQDPSTRSIVRYLFGGPDFLNAHAFFPEARILVLGGLEPVGEVPPPETLTPQAFAVGLQALREALHTSLFCGYFITSEMKPQLLDGSFRGVLPVLFTELALTGNKVISVELMEPFGSPGVKILYEHYDPRGDTQPQTLYYFQADLSNGKECKKFLGWLGEFGDGATYLKAASYLLPLDEFSETRDFLLNTSTLILQDDSGIPFHDFPPDQWKILLFGVYTDPLPIFKLHKEPELESAYAGIGNARNEGPLPFGAGYHVNAHDANLLLATRSNLTSQSVALPSSAAPLILPSPSPAATPKPRKMRIRKALPVEIRKALPVDIPTPLPPPVPAPVEMPKVSTPAPPQESQPETPSSPSPALSPTPPTEPAVPEPSLEPVESLTAPSPR